jgi:hypothetical protein
MFSQMKSERKKKTSFSQDEDKVLKEHIERYGKDQIHTLVQELPNRTAELIREYCRLYLNSAVNNDPFTPEEDADLLDHILTLKKLYTQIAEMTENRTDVKLKYQYQSKMKEQNRNRTSNQDDEVLFDNDIFLYSEFSFGFSDLNKFFD